MKIAIICRNEKDTIKESVKSAYETCDEVIVVDHGSADGTKDTLNSLGIKFKEEKPTKTKAEIKNQILSESKQGHVFFIGGNEKIIKNENLNFQKNAIRVNVINGDVISKEIRITNHLCKWENPVYEAVYTKDFHISGVCVKIIANNKENNESILEDWEKSKPLSLRPKYYKIMNYLSKNEYDKFINESKNYIHLDQSIDEGTVMMAYYRALVNLYQKNNYLDSVRDIVFCLSHNPYMSEFWCLLGDFYFNLKNLDKSVSFYENALIVASKRDFEDEWPIFISKYKAHPERMIGICKDYAKKIRND